MTNAIDDIEKDLEIYWSNREVDAYDQDLINHISDAVRFGYNAHKAQSGWCFDMDKAPRGCIWFVGGKYTHEDDEPFWQGVCRYEYDDDDFPETMKPNSVWGQEVRLDCWKPIQVPTPPKETT